MDTSPYLAAIQSLEGKKPSEKFKELQLQGRLIAKQLVDSNNQENIRISVDQSKIPPALHPLLYILVGNQLKSCKEVIEALKSEDLTVRNQALRANWFFNGSDVKLDAAFFVENVMPVVSVHTRKEVIKTLARNLMGKAQIADKFFETFFNLYGLHKTKPLLFACSDSLILDVILKHRIELTRRQIYNLFQMSPTLVVKYLRHGIKDDGTTENTLYPFLIPLHMYSKFLSNLIKNYPDTFFELYPRTNSVTVGRDLVDHLLQNNIDSLVKYPKILFQLLPLRIITKKLTTEQFQEFFVNLFPEEMEQFVAGDMTRFLEFVPKDKQLALLLEAFKLKYGKEILDDTSTVRSFELLQLLPADEREKQAKRLMASASKDSPDYYRWCCYLPPKQAFEIFKAAIAHASDSNDRIKFLKRMLRSCEVYESKEDLLQCLKYCYERHKNERASVLQELLAFIGTELPIDLLDKSHWSVLREIINWIYMKKELLVWGVDKIFSAALYHLLIQCKNEPTDADYEQFLGEILDLILEYAVEHLFGFGMVLIHPEMTKQYFDLLLNRLPLKYPDEHEIWKGKNRKPCKAYDIIQAIESSNAFYTSKSCLSSRKCQLKLMNYPDMPKKKDIAKLTFLSYPWLTNVVKDVLTWKTNADKYTIDKFRVLIKAIEPSFYSSIVEECMAVEQSRITAFDITSGRAIKLLQKDPEKIYNKWQMYLKACHDHMRYGDPALSIRRFIRATKWHQVLPINIVTHCLQDIKNTANILTLGILLEGDALCKTIGSLIPKNGVFEAEGIHRNALYGVVQSLSRAMYLTNPPVSIDTIESVYCGDFVRLAAPAVIKVSQKIPIPKAKIFAKRLINKQISVKKCGFFMYCRLAEKPELYEFFKTMWKTEKNPTIRQVVLKKILNFFKESPSEESWDLLRGCINDSICNNANLLDIVCGKCMRYWVCDNRFSGVYYVELFRKCEQLFENGDFDEKTTNDYLCYILNSAYCSDSIKNLPDEECTQILNRYILNFSLNTYSPIILSVIKFAIKNYLWETPDKYELRWNYLKQILTQINKKWNEPLATDFKTCPANYIIHTFFKELFTIHGENVYRWTIERNAIEYMFDVFSTVLAPHQEISSYLKLYFYKLYYESESWKDYGFKCGKKLSDLIKQFSSELIIAKVSDNIKYILKSLTKNDLDKYRAGRVEVMEGLMDADRLYGSFVCIRMLRDVSDKLDVYENVIRKLRENDNVVVQSYFNELSF